MKNLATLFCAALMFAGCRSFLDNRYELSLNNLTKDPVEIEWTGVNAHGSCSLGPGQQKSVQIQPGDRETYNYGVDNYAQVVISARNIATGKRYQPISVTLDRYRPIAVAVGEYGLGVNSAPPDHGGVASVPLPAEDPSGGVR